MGLLEDFFLIQFVFDVCWTRLLQCYRKFKAFELYNKGKMNDTHTHIYGLRLTAHEDHITYYIITLYII